MSLSRAEVEAMDRDELVEAVVELSDTVADLQATVEILQEDRDRAARERAEIRQDIATVRSDLETEVKDAEDRLHRERSKLTRRVSALEDEVGITAADAVAVAEGGEDATQLTRLARLVRHGPDAVTDRPTETVYRAKELVDNWDRWGTARDDAYRTERRLASKKHNLRTRLEDARDESLQWAQVYRAMEKIAEWSGGVIDLREGSEEEGKYVLVHRLEGDE